MLFVELHFVNDFLLNIFRSAIVTDNLLPVMFISTNTACIGKPFKQF